MSAPVEVTEHPLVGAFSRSSRVLFNAHNLTQLFSLFVFVVGLWLVSLIPVIGLITYLIYFLMIPYVGAFFLEVAHHVYSGREQLPPYPGKSDLLGIVTPGLAHGVLFVGLLVDLFPTNGLLAVWGAVLGFLAVPLNHSVNGGFPGDWDDWVSWFMGAALCSVTGASIVLVYDWGEALGPIRTMIPLLGALCLTVFSSALASELRPWGVRERQLRE